MPKTEHEVVERDVWEFVEAHRWPQALGHALVAHADRARGRTSQPPENVLVEYASRVCVLDGRVTVRHTLWVDQEVVAFVLDPLVPRKATDKFRLTWWREGAWDAGEKPSYEVRVEWGQADGEFVSPYAELPPVDPFEDAWLHVHLRHEEFAKMLARDAGQAGGKALWERLEPIVRVLVKK